MSPQDHALRLTICWREYAKRFDADSLREPNLRRSIELRERARTMRECARFVEVFVLDQKIEPIAAVRNLRVVRATREGGR